MQILRAEIKAVLVGLGYYVQEAEIQSLAEMKTLVNQIKPDQYPYATLSFGDVIDDEGATGMQGDIMANVDCSINTIHNANRSELPALRDAEERAIRDAIFDYLLNDQRTGCNWKVKAFRRAFLPGLRIDQKPAGGSGIQSKIKIRIKERS